MHPKADENFVHAISEGLLKVMSKMGISTVQSYRGAQIFEAVGLNRALIEAHFQGTPSRIEGIGLDELGREIVERHQRGFGLLSALELEVPVVGGKYQWRRDAETHKWNLINYLRSLSGKSPERATGKEPEENVILVPQDEKK
jgi:glutamate synthase (NADPH/NADH) large chain